MRAWLEKYPHMESFCTTKLDDDLAEDCVGAKSECGKRGVMRQPRGDKGQTKALHRLAECNGDLVEVMKKVVSGVAGGGTGAGSAAAAPVDAAILKSKKLAGLVGEKRKWRELLEEEKRRVQPDVDEIEMMECMLAELTRVQKTVTGGQSSSA